MRNDRPAGRGDSAQTHASQRAASTRGTLGRLIHGYRSAWRGGPVRRSGAAARRLRLRCSGGQPHDDTIRRSALHGSPDAFSYRPVPGPRRIKPLLRAGSWILVLAANAPDIDIVTLAGGQLNYLNYHRHLTHSLAAWPADGAAAGVGGAAVHAQAVPLAGGVRYLAGGGRVASAARLDQRLRHPPAAAVLRALVPSGPHLGGGSVDLGRAADSAGGAG